MSQGATVPRPLVGSAVRQQTGGGTGTPRARGQVWRLHGERVFAVTAAVVFLVEAASLGTLTWALAFHGEGSGGYWVRNTLVGAVGITALAVVVVTGALLMVRAATVRRDERFDRLVADSVDTWRAVVATGAPCPDSPLPAESAAALLEVREHARGAAAEVAAAAVVDTGTDRELLRRLAAIEARGGWWRWPLRGRSQRLGEVLAVLEDLARARVADAVPRLVPLISRPEPPVRLLALRASARSIAAMTPGQARTDAALELLAAIAPAGFTRGAYDEAVFLLGPAAEPVIGYVLDDPGADAVLLTSCLDSAGRLGLADLAPRVSRYVGRDRPVEVRAASLRALATLGILPDDAASGLSAAMGDEEEAVRVQAARAGYLLDPRLAVRQLNVLLGDPSWWVRRAAAESLSRVPLVGRPELEAAASGHADRFAQDMATDVLRRTPSLDAVGDRDTGVSDAGAGNTRGRT